MATKGNGKAVDTTASETNIPINGSRHHRTSTAKPNGKSPIGFGTSSDCMMFRDITVGPHESELRFRLIHLWEARVALKRTLLGLEMLLIDGEGTVIKGFIAPGKMGKFRPYLKKGAVYRLFNFFGSRSKPGFRVAEHNLTVSFSHNSELTVLTDSDVVFEEDRFRIHGYEDLKANCDAQGDLYDVVGHIKLVHGQSLHERPVIDESEIANSRRIVVHIQPHQGPVMKLFLWEAAAIELCKKFNALAKIPTALLVTTVNPKTVKGTFAISSMSSSRVFFDNEVPPTREYNEWLGSHPEIANQVNVVSCVLAKSEIKLLDHFKQVNFFECIATIDDVSHSSPWYYIGCGACKTKATKGATSLMCGKCGTNNIIGEAQFIAKLSVYDKTDEAVFVLLCDAGRELTGKSASELVRKYFEDNGEKKPGCEVPVPQALIDTIGKTQKFSVKVSDHNLSGRSRSLTITKVLPLPFPPVEQPMASVTEECVELDVDEDATNPSVKRMGDDAVLGNGKRSKNV